MLPTVIEDLILQYVKEMQEYIRREEEKYRFEMILLIAERYQW